MEENTNYNIGSNEIDYTPEFVDIEGLQGINSSQGMERFMQNSNGNNMGSMYGSDEMVNNEGTWAPMNGMENSYNVPPVQCGMDNMYNTPPMQGMGGYNYMPTGGTCTEVIRCLASLCYMASLSLMQMVQCGNGYDMNMGQNPMGQNPMGQYPMVQPPMGGCGCAGPTDYTQNDEYGYPPIY